MREIALAQNGVLGKIAFLKTFWGIGDKYARNFWMDVCHEEFIDSVAIDLRLEKVALAINPILQTYHDFEEFYRGIADDVGLDLWTVDRLVFHLYDNGRLVAQLEEAKTSPDSGSRSHNRSRKQNDRKCY